MKNISHSQLLDIVKNSRGTLIAGIEALTDAKARKTGNPFGTVFKHSRSVGFIGVNYENAVNREGVRQGVEANFEADSLPWGEWLIPNKIISHKGELYLRTQSTPGQRMRQRAKILSYRNEVGAKLAREEVSPFLPPKVMSAKQARAGLADEVSVRVFKFSSIQKIRVKGETFNLVKG